MDKQNSLTNKTRLAVIGMLMLSYCYAQRTAVTNSQTASPLRGSGIRFTQNKGQIMDMQQRLRPDILYKGSGGGADVYIRKTGISYVLNNINEVKHKAQLEAEEMLQNGIVKTEEAKKLKEKLLANQTVKLHRIDVDFVNCNPDAQMDVSEQTDLSVEASAQTEGHSNYYYAHCPQGITNVNSYNHLTIKNIYNNIDVKYYGGKDKGLKYDIVVNPGGNPNDIKLKYSGAEEVEIKNEKLIIKNSIGDIVEQLPKVYQNINGKIIDVKAWYIIDGTTANLKLETWNPLYPLVIDPWVTYYGGANAEEIYGITTDPIGNPVFTGWTMSANFPVAAGPFQGTLNGIVAEDAFMAKMTPAGTLLYSTYIGGSQADVGWDVACDAAGNILVTGTTTSVNFPIGSSGANVVHQNINGGTSAFIFKFDPAGARLWSTYYGGSGVNSNSTQGRSVTTDGSNVIIFGTTSSTTAIATPGTIQPTITPSGGGIANPLYVAKFASNGARLWGTYLNGGTYAGGIACDAAGNIFAAGSAWAGFPTTAGAHQTVWGGGSGADAILCKVNPTGTTMLWSTYYGGNSTDEGGAVEVDNSGNVILAGWGSPGGAGPGYGISTAGSWQPTSAGSDIFIAKFNTNGVRQWATYLGSATQDFFGGLALDNLNNIYVSGEWEDASNPQNYPVSACAYQPNRGGDEDDYIAKYDPNGKQLCFTYIGGTGQDEAAGEIGLSEGGGPMAIFQNQLYFTCLTNGGYPVTPGAFQTVYGGAPTNAAGNWEAAISQLCTNICEAKFSGLDFSAGTTSVCKNNPVAFTPTLSTTCDSTGSKFQWTFTGGSPGSSTAVTPTVTYPATGVYPVKLVLITTCKKDSITKTGYITVNACGCVLSAAATVTSNVNCAGANNGSANVVISNGSGGTYSYSWSNGTSGTTTANTIPISGLAANTYTVTITDGSCISISSVTITQALSINTINSTNVTCNNGNNGSITVNISVGAGSPYTYSWSNGTSTVTTSATQQLNNLSAGTYTVTVKEGACTAVSTVTITQPIPMTIGFSSTQYICPGSIGNVTAYPGNGSTPYNYLWSNGQTSPTASGLSPGTYIVTVTDNKGCSITNAIIIDSPMAIGTSVTNISCTTPGYINVQVSGANPFTYTWSSGQTSYLISGLAAGGYSLTVTDANGCSATQSFIITGTSPVSAAFTYSQTCAGSLVNFTNTGTPPGAGVTYNWLISPITPTNVSGTTTDFSYTFLSPGSYTVQHGVGNGTCSNTITKVITVINCNAGPTVIATGSSVCVGICAAVTSSGTGGASPYTYSWNTGETTQNINPCPSSTTTYTVTIRDTGGNTSTSTAVVTINPAVSVNTTVTNISCNGGTNGSTIASPGGGTSPYIYVWSNGQTSQTATNLTAGNYTVTVVDAKGCTSTTSTTIVSPQPLLGQFTKGTASCSACGCKQWVMVNAAGGTSPYSYTWPDGYVNRYKNQLCPGAYSINIKDKNGCNVNISVTAP